MTQERTEGWAEGRYTTGVIVPDKWVLTNEDGVTIGIVERTRYWHTSLTAYALHEPDFSKEPPLSHFTILQVDCLEKGKALVEEWLTPDGHARVHDYLCRFV